MSIQSVSKNGNGDEYYTPNGGVVAESEKEEIIKDRQVSLFE